jgi:hypothetical protein
MTPIESRERTTEFFDACAWLVLALVLAFLLATFRDYGVAWDEGGEAIYGGLLLKYFASGFRDHSAFDYINFRYYGGGFELPSAMLARVLPFGEFETRHLLSACLGLGGLIATWRVARRLGGARAGLIALLLLALNPGWYGHGFINARDTPMAAGMAVCLLLTLQMLDELPRIRLRTRISFGLALGWTVSVRVGGVLSLAFALVPISLWLGERARSAGVQNAARDAVHIGWSLLQMLAIAYAMMGVFWPWALLSPGNPAEALLMFSRFPFNAPVLFQGRLVPASELPASYLPVQFLLRQPESLLAGLGLFAVLGALALRRARPWAALRAIRLDAHAALWTVVVAAAFPFAYSMVARPVDYNGMRHFLFVVPSVAVLAALAFDRAFAAKPRAVRAGLALALGAALLVQTRALFVLHPEQYVYINDLAGGPEAARGRYELDYWGTSLAEATRRLTDYLELRDELPDPGEPPLKVYVCGNVSSAATFFPPGLVPVERLEEGDLQISIDAHFCTRPSESRRLLEVERDGALLSFVDDLRSRRAPSGDALQSRAKSAPEQNRMR